MSFKLIGVIILIAIALIPLARILAPVNNPGRAFKIITYTLAITLVLIILCFIILMTINEYRFDLAERQGRELQNEGFGIITFITFYAEIYIFVIGLITSNLIKNDLKRPTVILLSIIFLIIAVIPNLVIAGVWTALTISEGISLIHLI